MSLRVRAVLAVFALVACGRAGNEPHDVRRADIRAAEDSLAHAFRIMDFAGGARLGERLLERAPGHPAVRARAIELLARDGRERRAESLADSFARMEPGSPWAWYAVAAATYEDPVRSQDGVEASARAVELAPDHLPSLRLRAEVLANAAHEDEVAPFLDSLPPELRGTPALTALRGLSLSYRGYMGGDSALKAQARSAYARALGKEPDDVRALWWMGLERAVFEGRPARGVPYLARAVRLTPSATVHEAYWQALRHDADLDATARESRIEADVDSLLARHPDSPESLRAAAAAFGLLKRSETRDVFESRLLARFPRSPQAENVLLDRTRRLGRAYAGRTGDGGKAAALREAFRRAVDAFLDRPVHHSEAALGEAYLDLYQLLADREDSDPDSLLLAVRGMRAHESSNAEQVYGRSAVTLAERGIAPSLAERLPQEGLTAVTRNLRAHRDRYSTRDDFRNALHLRWSQLLDALGWVYFLQGRLEPAENVLRASRGFMDGASVDHHLGRVLEARARRLAGSDDPDREAIRDSLLAEAQGLYIRGSLASGQDADENEAALKSLYRRLHGSSEGYEAFHRERVEAERKRRVLADRLDPPLAVRPFSLKDLSGRVVRLADRRAPVTVIDFWGTWCGPCVEEMPELQKVYDRYRADPDVLILTVDYGDTPREVRSWVEEKGYTFPVLLDDGYVMEAGVNGFPTTWFLGASGRIEYRRTGNSGHLADGFEWRIEALRAAGSQGPPARGTPRSAWRGDSRSSRRRPGSGP